MESIIKAMDTLIDNIACAQAGIGGQEEEMFEPMYWQMGAAIELAQAILDALKRIEASTKETAEVITAAIKAKVDHTEK